MWTSVVISLGLFLPIISGDTLRFKPQPGGGATSIICPDKQGTCPNGSTCCKLSSGKYGCCPLPQATCCSDHLHCCPHYYKCNVTAGACQKGDISIPMVTKLPASPLQPEPSGGKDVVCPGGKATCPDGTTCCKLTSGQYGCCPLPKATCCSDGLHCCPAGYTCNTKKGSCDKDKIQNSWIPLKVSTPLQATRGSTGQKVSPLQKVAAPSQKTVAPPSRQIVKPLNKKKMVCPGGKSYCEGGRTCCFEEKGKFACCPYVNGICCGDKKHCCPLGFTCDLKLSKCTKVGGITLPWGETHESKSTDHETPEEGEPVKCPDETSQCPAGSTCCLLLSGEYGCCPLAKAVCCSDHLHCCPEGSTCDVQAGTCQSGTLSEPWSTKTAAAPVDSSSVAENKCGDNKTSCPTETTCCLMLDGYYSCCPYPDALCCDDKLHCCPKGETCDTKKGECVSSVGTRSPWGEKFPSTAAPSSEWGETLLAVAPPSSESASSDGVKCPGGKVTCAGSSTCCEMSSGGYACCPLVKAVCCSDKLHCCPEGYKCNVAAGTCSSFGLELPWYHKLPAQPVIVEGTLNEPITAQDISHEPIREGEVKCPDQKSYCPDKTTCCLLASRQYGCCPLPEAICCKDGVHCCPSGYKCDTQKGACEKSTSDLKTIPWVEKIPAQPVDAPTEQWVVCPDKKSQCQDGYTCCQMSSGAYGCCPMPKAVCCSDQVHCCPSGTKCDVTKGSCDSVTNSLSVSWSVVHRPSAFVSTAEPALGAPSMGAAIKCGDKSECPRGNTCCLMTSGKYGCCPYSDGTCCSDKVHCCPSGFVCDPSSKRCDKKDASLTLTSTIFTHFKPAPSSEERSGAGLVCPGGKTSCPDTDTCCKSATGTYGCCPFKQAVCCTDGEHCCPQGYACDLQSGTCTQASVLPWVTKIPATPRQPAQVPQPSDTTPQSIICPDRQHQCPEGNTCCPLGGSQWGCCPLERAVCCSDDQHCCPHGYKCQVQSQSCIRDDGATTIATAFLSIATSTSDHADQP